MEIHLLEEDELHEAAGLWHTSRSRIHSEMVLNRSAMFRLHRASGGLAKSLLPTIRSGVRSSLRE